ncbi:MAG: hypothetical protein VKS61_18745 [Candidatus Sericytochromatia bacterium]|nr:hypothetical protein [Candidatus Sericytochromatia bacterium]
MLAAAGCGAPGPGTLVVPGARAPRGLHLVARVERPDARGLLALLTENRRRLHHVNLSLFRQASDGTWPAVPEATRVGVPAASLGNPIALGALRFGTTYKLTLAAYADASESLATLVSDAALSQLTFTTPAPRLVGSALTVERELALTVPLVLLNTPYAGRATYSLAVLNPQVTHVRLELTTPSGSVASRLYPRGSTPATGLLDNLKLGSTYTLRATGLKGSATTGDVLASAAATVTMPLVAPDGTVETGPFGPLSLTLN